MRFNNLFDDSIFPFIWTNIFGTIYIRYELLRTILVLHITFNMNLSILNVIKSIDVK